MTTKYYIPRHPGEILRDDVMPALNLTQADLSRKTGISAWTLGRIVNKRSSITPKTAARLEQVGLCDARFWNESQKSYNLYLENTK